MKGTLAATLLAGAGSPSPAAENKGSMPYRVLGRTEEKVSAIGLGGFHIGMQNDEEESIALIPQCNRRRHYLHGQLLGL